MSGRRLGGGTRDGPQGQTYRFAIGVALYYRQRASILNEVRTFRKVEVVP